MFGTLNKPKGWSPVGTATYQEQQKEPVWEWCPECWGQGAIWHPLTKIHLLRKICEFCLGVGSVCR